MVEPHHEEGLPSKKGEISRVTNGGEKTRGKLRIALLDWMMKEAYKNGNILVIRTCLGRWITKEEEGDNGKVSSMFTLSCFTPTSKS